MFPEDFTRIINVKSEDFVNRNVKRGGKEKESILWKEGIDNTLSNTEGIQIEYLDENQYFEDYLDKHLGVSKVVDENGEPLIVYHGTTTPDITTFDLDKTQSGKAFWFANENAQKAVVYFGQNNENLILMPLFVNMKTPLLNDDGSMEPYATDETHDGGLILAKVGDLKSIASEKEYQEWLDKGLNDDSYLAAGNVSNPNQLKSAINNNGNFSKTDDNIYHSLYYSDMIPYVIPFLRDSGIAHMWGGKLRLTKYNPAAKLQLEKFCNTYGLYADIKDDGVIELYETDDKDEIREHVQDMREVNQIIRFLQQRFPGLKARWVSDAEIKKATGRSARACVKGDTVFLSY